MIVKVVQRDEVTPAQVKSGSEAFRAELVNERRANFFNAYMGKAKERMKVEINAGSRHARHDGASPVGLRP